jgi:hypothetical protein
MNPETSAFLIFLVSICAIPGCLLIVAVGLAIAMRSSQISREEEQRR